MDQPSPVSTAARYCREPIHFVEQYVVLNEFTHATGFRYDAKVNKNRFLSEIVQI